MKEVGQDLLQRYSLEFLLNQNCWCYFSAVELVHNGSKTKTNCPHQIIFIIMCVFTENLCYTVFFAFLTLSSM